jgi:PGF-CTERM protein
MRVEDAVVAERRGELEAGASTTVTFEERFDEPGTYRVHVGARELLVEVVEPPSPTVENVDVPRTVASGEEVTLSFSVRNDAPVPGRLVVPISIDGEVLSNETILVPASSSVERTYTVSFTGAGEHEVRVRDTIVTVRVTGETTAGSPSDATTTEDALPVPGFGAGVALAALLALLAFATRRGRS